jgi:hypothetical protein
MYSVKVYNRNNAVMIDSTVFPTRSQADEHYLSVGFGEGYWAELHKEFFGLQYLNG